MTTAEEKLILAAHGQNGDVLNDCVQAALGLADRCASIAAQVAEVDVLRRRVEVLERLVSVMRQSSATADEVVAGVALALKEERERCAVAAASAPLPSGYQWGPDARAQFRVGTEQAAATIRALSDRFAEVSGS